MKKMDPTKIKAKEVKFEDGTQILHFLCQKLDLQFQPLKEIDYISDLDFLELFCKGIEKHENINQVFLAEDLGLEENRISPIFITLNPFEQVVALTIQRLTPFLEIFEVFETISRDND